MARTVTVTAAQKTAATYIVERSARAGRPVPSWVRKVAEAAERKPRG